MLLPREQAARVWLMEVISMHSWLGAYRCQSRTRNAHRLALSQGFARCRARPTFCRSCYRATGRFLSAAQGTRSPRSDFESLNQTSANSCLSVYFRAAIPYRPAMLITVALSFRPMKPSELELPLGLARPARRLATTSCIERRRRRFVGLPFDRRSSLPAPTSRATRESPCHHDTIPTGVRSVGVACSG